jgi:hypothetical protein
LILEFSNNHKSYIEYKRKRKTILDLVAKISSLFRTLHFVFLFVFKNYSKNFNNFKIIEKILDINNKNFKEKELIVFYLSLLTSTKILLIIKIII